MGATVEAPQPYRPRTAFEQWDAAYMLTGLKGDPASIDLPAAERDLLAMRSAAGVILAELIRTNLAHEELLKFDQLAQAALEIARVETRILQRDVIDSDRFRLHLRRRRDTAYALAQAADGADREIRRLFYVIKEPVEPTPSEPGPDANGSEATSTQAPHATNPEITDLAPKDRKALFTNTGRLRLPAERIQHALPDGPFESQKALANAANVNLKDVKNLSGPMQRAGLMKRLRGRYQSP